MDHIVKEIAMRKVVYGTTKEDVWYISCHTVIAPYK